MFIFHFLDVKDTISYICLYSSLSRIQGLRIEFRLSLRLASFHIHRSTSVTYNSNSNSNPGKSRLKTRSQSTNFKPLTWRPVPNYSPPRTPVAGVAQLGGQTLVAPTQAQIQVAIPHAEDGPQIYAETRDSTESQVHLSKPLGTGQSKPKGRKQAKKMPVLTRHYLRRVNPILLSLSTGLADIDRIDKVACYILYAFWGQPHRTGLVSRRP